MLTAGDAAPEFVLPGTTGGNVESYALADHPLVANRSVFVVDGDRTVRFAWAVDDPSERPDWDAVKGALEAL